MPYAVKHDAHTHTHTQADGHARTHSVALTWRLLHCSWTNSRVSSPLLTFGLIHHPLSGMDDGQTRAGVSFLCVCVCLVGVSGVGGSD